MNDKPPLILVVDDYQDAREMYAEYLQFSGFRVAEAKNGNEAIDQAFALKPDLILMDIKMPKVDGCTATQRLKADHELSAIPVIGITASISITPSAIPRAMWPSTVERVKLRSVAISSIGFPSLKSMYVRR